MIIGINKLTEMELTKEESAKVADLQKRLPNCTREEILGVIEIEREEAITGRSNKWYAYIAGINIRDYKRGREKLRLKYQS